MPMLRPSYRAVLLTAAFSATMIFSAAVHDVAAQTTVSAVSSSAPPTAQLPRPSALTAPQSDPLPRDLQEQLYSKPVRAPEITPAQVIGKDYYQDGETIVGRKVEALRRELNGLQNNVKSLSERLTAAQNSGQSQAAEYYANVATISTQLQSGTTPGNPRLIKRLAVARDSLESLGGSVSSLNDLAMEASNASSMSNFLLESVRTTYSLSGAIEEDHVRLAQLEDSINNTAVAIERLQNNLNDDITRIVSYLGSERNNLRTLSLAITTGDLFGKSLTNRPFSNAQPASFSPDTGTLTPEPGASIAPRPLAKIKFDKATVNYEQPVYMAVNEALQRYPNARFELVAVHPSGKNPAEGTIESTRARRNAEKVLSSLMQMGLTMDRIDLSYMPSSEAATSEVHLYVR